MAHPYASAAVTSTARVCRCFRLTRRDGTVMGFTDHDVAVTFDGTTFQPETALDATDTAQKLGLAPDELEATGALSAAAVRYCQCNGRAAWRGVPRADGVAPQHRARAGRASPRPARPGSRADHDWDRSGRRSGRRYSPPRGRRPAPVPSKGRPHPGRRRAAAPARPRVHGKPGHRTSCRAGGSPESRGPDHRRRR